MPNVTFLNIPILINQGFPVRRMIGIKAHLNLLPVILLLRRQRQHKRHRSTRCLP